MIAKVCALSYNIEERLFSMSQGEGFYPVLGQKFQPVKKNKFT